MRLALSAFAILMLLFASQTQAAGFSVVSSQESSGFIWDPIFYSAAGLSANQNMSGSQALTYAVGEFINMSALRSQLGCFPMSSQVAANSNALLPNDQYQEYQHIDNQVGSLNAGARASSSIAVCQAAGIAPTVEVSVSYEVACKSINILSSWAVTNAPIQLSIMDANSQVHAAASYVAYHPKNLKIGNCGIISLYRFGMRQGVMAGDAAAMSGNFNINLVNNSRAAVSNISLNSSITSNFYLNGFNH